MSTGIVRRVKLDSNDSMIQKLANLDRNLRKEGRALFTSWTLQRRYTPRELASADLFNIWPKCVFEPAGEECGTVYDDSATCACILEPGRQVDIGGLGASIPSATCGAGARQVTPLFLDGRRIPRNVDFAQTIAGEIVVSSRVIDVFRTQGLRGGEFEAVRLSDRHGAPSDRHFQLQVPPPQVEIDPATRVGENPLEEEPHGACPRGHVMGLNLLSEVKVKAATVPDVDLMATKQLIGIRRGLLRPRHVLLVSSRGWRAIDEAGLKGLEAEVAHIV